MTLPLTQSFRIAWEPTAKERPRVTRRGTYTAPKTATAERSIGWLLNEAHAQCYPAHVPLQVNLVFYMRRPRKPVHPYWAAVRPDIDQLEKLILDAGNGILWHDDAQICLIQKEKHYAPAGEEPHIYCRVGLL